MVNVNPARAPHIAPHLRVVAEGEPLAPRVVLAAGASVADAARVAAILDAFPPALRALDVTVEVGGPADDDRAAMLAIGALPEPPAGDEADNVALLALARTIEGNRAGAVRVPAPLLASTEGRDGLLAFALIVQLAPHHLASCAEANADWTSFWRISGSDEALARLAAPSAVPGYALALALFALAPGALLRRAPVTFTMICTRFGDSLARLPRQPGDAQAIDAASALADLIAFVRAGS